MMEKEIKAYGSRNDTIIRFLKTDNAKLGKVYVLYPYEYDELKIQIKELELKLAIEISKNIELKEELKSNTDNGDFSLILTKLSNIEERIGNLESIVKK